MRNLGGILALAALAACGGAVSPTSGDRPSAAVPPRRASAPLDDSPVDGTWKGYIESFQLASGSSALTMRLQRKGHDVTGTVIFGDAPPPPAPSDPSVGYPPSANLDRVPMGSYVGEGFPYTLSGTLDGARLQLGVVTRELWAGWCALQTSYPLHEGSDAYGCLPNLAFGQHRRSDRTTCFQADATLAEVPVDCDKLALCNKLHVCACKASGCSVSVSTADTRFDVHVVGAAADGSTSGALGGHNVHLTRAQ